MARVAPDVTAIHLGRSLPTASSNQPGRQGWKQARALARPVVPIRSCSRWGLPCRRRCRRRGALLPHPFTLALLRQRLRKAVCFLWHCPWGHPRRTLSGTVFPRSPDFPLHRRGRCSGRPADWRNPDMGWHPPGSSAVRRTPAACATDHGRIDQDSCEPRVATIVRTLEQ
jgi:hypothetical protein